MAERAEPVLSRRGGWAVLDLLCESMPIYEFECEECGCRFEELSPSDTPSLACPACGSERARRLISPVSPAGRQPRGAGVRSDESRRRRARSGPERAARRDQTQARSGGIGAAAAWGGGPDAGERRGAAGGARRALQGGPGLPKCPLHETRTKAVFGAGDADADLMFVGEAPGAEEDRQGLPFVGRAGQLLNQMLEGIGLSREDVFIANVLKRRPPGNRDPQPLEIEACRPYLFEQVRLIEPTRRLHPGQLRDQAAERQPGRDHQGARRRRRSTSSAAAPSSCCRSSTRRRRCARRRSRRRCAPTSRRCPACSPGRPGRRPKSRGGAGGGRGRAAARAPADQLDIFG